MKAFHFYPILHFTEWCTQKVIFYRKWWDSLWLEVGPQVEVKNSVICGVICFHLVCLFLYLSFFFLPYLWIMLIIGYWKQSWALLFFCNAQISQVLSQVPGGTLNPQANFKVKTSKSWVNTESYTLNFDAYMLGGQNWNVMKNWYDTDIFSKR